MNITFAKTRWEYQSYTDFWKLVELSQFPTCFVDEMDVYNPDNVYIVAPMNGEWRPFIDSHFNRKAKLILWNLERPGGSGSIGKYRIDNHVLISNGYVDRIVVSDISLASQCGLDYLTLGGHPDLGIPGFPSMKKYDLIHLSCYSNHRSWMFDTPDRPKIELYGRSVARNGWGQDRHWSLQESRYMLSVHQDGFPFIEPLRFVLAAEYALPIISEHCDDAFPYTPYVIPLEKLKDGLAYNDEIYMFGQRLRAYINQYYPFRECVEAYVKKL